MQIWVCRAERVFDGERVLADHAVVVRGERIEAVLPAAAAPAGLPVVAEPDATIIPGLIDAHVHFMRWEGPLFLAYGVTAVRDTGNALEWILARRAEWMRHPWPRLFCLGPILDGLPPFHPRLARACADRETAVTAVRETAAAGVDGIKLYVNLRPDWIAPMVAEAHRAGLKVSSHSVGNGVLFMGQAGVDEVFHLDGLLPDLWPDAPPGWLSVWGLPEFAATRGRQPAVADAIRQMDLTVTPTLAFWDSQWRVRTPGYPHADEGRHVPAQVNRSMLVAPADPAGAMLWRRALEAALAFTGLLATRGIRFLAGSDVPCGGVSPGLSLWREMALLTQTGLTPLQALQAATGQPAAFLGKPELGRLRPGAFADLAFVQGNPLAGIPADPVIPAVIRAGRLYRREALLAAAANAVDTLGEDPPGQQWLAA